MAPVDANRPPPARPSPRLAGLDAAAVGHVLAAAQALELGHAEQAEAHLGPLLAAYPEHPEVLRLHAGARMLRGDQRGALAAMRRAVRQRPDDPVHQNTLATILASIGDLDAAVESLARACRLEPDLAVAWFNLGVLLTRSVRHEEAARALQRCVEIAPEHADARALLADLARMRGDFAQAAGEYRRILDTQPWNGMAWWGLADLRQDPFTDGDVEAMQAALRDARASDGDRIATGFALAKAYDQHARYADALDALQRANALARTHQHWDAAAFTAVVAAIDCAFAPPPAPAPTADLGHEAIFIVGMPRSGTTLVEQILASHRDVAGAGELPDLPAVLTEASRRTGLPFPAWASRFAPSDWQQLGARYLERTARWRNHKPRFTDKLPANWQYIGAIRAALPGAHIVVCGRDPLETCFSCYRQHLAGNEYTRTFPDLAAYWRDFDQTTRRWVERQPEHVHAHVYERLIEEPRASISELLSSCGLSPDDDCFRFHATEREIRSPSATQVRRPLQRNTARGALYGTLLDPLRALLNTRGPDAGP